MQSTNFRSTNTTFHIPLTVYLLVAFGSARLVWFPLLVAVRLGKARAQRELREQIIGIGESSI